MVFHQLPGGGRHIRLCNAIQRIHDFQHGLILRKPVHKIKAARPTAHCHFPFQQVKTFADGKHLLTYFHILFQIFRNLFRSVFFHKKSHIPFAIVLPIVCECGFFFLWITSETKRFPRSARRQNRTERRSVPVSAVLCGSPHPAGSECWLRMYCRRLAYSWETC